MGLGKTVTLIYEAEILKSRGLIDHCFIICGVDSLRQQWKAEIEKFSNQDVLVLGEKISKSGKVSYASLAERAKQLKDPISEFFVITNIASIRSDEIVEAFSYYEDFIIAFSAMAILYFIVIKNYISGKNTLLEIFSARKR